MDGHIQNITYLISNILRKKFEHKNLKLISLDIKLYQVTLSIHSLLFYFYHEYGKVQTLQHDQVWSKFSRVTHHDR